MVEPLHNKRFLIHNLLVQKHEGATFQGLLEALSLKELRILCKHEDLVDRVSEITKMSDQELLEVVKEDYQLEPANCATGDVWLGVENLEDRIPEDFVTRHSGWYLSLKDGEFNVWAKHFLMQEVRINIWIRYLEHKKKNPGKQRKAISDYEGLATGYGNYL
jgi:hypothetical protein